MDIDLTRLTATQARFLAQEQPWVKIESLLASFFSIAELGKFEITAYGKISTQVREELELREFKVGKTQECRVGESREECFTTKITW